MVNVVDSIHCKQTNHISLVLLHHDNNILITAVIQSWGLLATLNHSSSCPPVSISSILPTLYHVIPSLQLFVSRREPTLVTKLPGD